MLRDIRDLRGETQQALGRLLGWSVSTVSRFEAAYPDYPALRLFGDEAKPLPVWAEAAPREQWADVEAPLGTLDLSEPPPDVRRWRYWEECSPRESGTSSAAWRSGTDTSARSTRASGRISTPGPDHPRLAAMARDDHGRLRLDCKLGTYFHSLSTSETLDPELMEAYAA
ncbi:MAG TPA: helix-turn-helix transcriptional regulator [Actinomycetota bacterium]|nr:helix-turn-helix transcriptional regulator [Actinomycetota bacterium]